METRKNKRKFAAFDIDGTLFRSGLYREVANKLIEMGAINDESACRAREKRAQWKRRDGRNSYDEYEWALIEALDGSLTEIPTALYDQAVESVVCRQLENVYTYTRHELQRLQKLGYFLIAISGSQEELVEPFAQKYGFDTWVGQKYTRTADGENFTGEITKTYTGKDKILQKIIAEHDLTLDDSYAYGDSAGDRGMLEMVENPVAFNPTIELENLAEQAGWPIVIERKSVIYQLRKDENGLYVLAKASKI